MKLHPIKPPVFVKEISAGRSAVREVRDVETASRIHLAWPGRGKAWRHAAEVQKVIGELSGSRRSVGYQDLEESPRRLASTLRIFALVTPRYARVLCDGDERPQS